MTLLIWCLSVAIGFLIAIYYERNTRWKKTRRELTDLQVCYRDAIDGKLAVMRELEDARKKT